MRNDLKVKDKNVIEAKLRASVLSYKKLSGRRVNIILIFIAILFATTIWAIAVGVDVVGLKEVFKSIGDVITHSSTVDDTHKYISLYIRLPRVFTAMAAGAALSLSGLLMQAIFQNPLVSPYTLGISNGASFGASLAIIMGSSFGIVNSGLFITPLFAFLFAILTMLIVFVIAKFAGQSSKTLILTGVAVGYLFSALVSGLKYISDVKDLPELVYWTMGNISGSGWRQVIIISAVLGVCSIIAMFKAWDLNAMMLGKEEASALGVNYNASQTLTFVMTTILTAVTVSFTGVIGFVGLVAPHITRMLIGNDYRYNIPLSIGLGAVLLLTADTIARTIIMPTELPVGIITSIIGVPFFLYLVIKGRGRT